MKLFSKKTKISDEQFYAPVSGTILPIEEVSDPMFAKKLIGDGIAFVPTDGEVVAPTKGEIVQVFPTKHAIGIKSEAGFEVLLHVGIETVAMGGEGFTVYVNPGDKVNIGDKLLTFDLDLVKEKAASTAVPMVITNSEKIESMNKTTETVSNKRITQVLHVKVKN